MAVHEVSLLDLAREINSSDYNSFINCPSFPKMKYHAWYHLYPTGHNTTVITAGLGSITENETPANASKHPCLPSSYPGAVIVFTYYHAFISLLRTSEML